MADLGGPEEEEFAHPWQRVMEDENATEKQLAKVDKYRMRLSL